MAEILLSLTIIGVVAAITLPSLTGNINERTWNTQRKALYARMSQAVALMPSLNGYGTLTEGTDSSGSKVVTEDTAAETFVTDGLSKVLKINNICDYEHLDDCGIPSKITALNGSLAFSQFPETLVGFNEMFNSVYVDETYGTNRSYSQIDTRAAAFETQNGESIVVYYNPNCASNMDEKSFWAQSKMCANFVYDLNGSKGPNTVGKDVGFMSVLYPSDSTVVAPVPLSTPSTAIIQAETSGYCLNIDSNSRMPNLQELASIFFNKKLIGTDFGDIGYWTGTLGVSNAGVPGAWHVNLATGTASVKYKTDRNNVMCVRRD